MTSHRSFRFQNNDNGWGRLLSHEHPARDLDPLGVDPTVVLGQQRRRIEDLLEEIVGEIRDEHEEDVAIEEPQREPRGVWLVPGNFPVDQLSGLFGEQTGFSELDKTYEATTLGGLVSEIEGRIPLAGEVVVLEEACLRMEIVASTDRRVERLRIFPPPTGDGGESCMEKPSWPDEPSAQKADGPAGV